MQVVHSMLTRRELETYIIRLKEDLKTADLCRDLRNKICQTVSDPQLFTTEIASQFKADQFTYEINNNECSQALLLKQVINTLTKTLASIETIENLDIKRERYEVGIWGSIAVKSSSVINNLYELTQLIDQSPEQLQKLLSPLSDELMPNLSEITAVFSKNINEQTSPLTIRENAGQVIGTAVNLLPKTSLGRQQSQQLFVKEIFNLPIYFKQISKITLPQYSKKIDELLSDNVTQEKILSAEELQELTEKFEQQKKLLGDKAESAQEQINNLMQSTNYATKSYYYAGTVKAIAAISTDLLNTSQPVTKEAYIRSVKLLNQLRHQHIPKLISQVDLIEENLGLQSGALTDQLIDSLDGYYRFAVEYVNCIKDRDLEISKLKQHADSFYGKPLRHLVGDHGEQIIHEEQDLNTIATDLLTLQDHTFVETRQQLLEQRTIIPEEKLIKLQQVKEDATSFFKKCYAFSSAFKLGTMQNIPSAERLIMAREYKQVQTYVAKQDKQTDETLVEVLNVTMAERLQLIAECKLSDEQKQLLGQALKISVSQAKDCIKTFDIEEKAIATALELAIDHADCTNDEFIETVMLISKPQIEQGFFAASLNITSKALGLAVYGLGVACQAALSTVMNDDFANVLNIKTPVLALINKELEDQKLKLSILKKQKLNAIKQSEKPSLKIQQKADRSIKNLEIRTKLSLEKKIEIKSKLKNKKSQIKALKLKKKNSPIKIEEYKKLKGSEKSLYLLKAQTATIKIEKYWLQLEKLEQELHIIEEKLPLTNSEFEKLKAKQLDLIVQGNLAKKTTIAFKMLEDVNQLSNLSSTEIAHQLSLYKKQEGDLEKYKKSLTNLFNLLEDSEEKSTVLYSLPEEHKQQLCSALFPCQPFLAHLDPNNRRIENKFIQSFFEESSLTIQDLLNDRQHIMSSLEYSINISNNQHLNLQSKYEKKCVHELRDTNLTVLNIEPELTLLKNISRLKPHEKMHEFRTQYVKTFLQEHLCEDLFQKLDVDNLKYPIENYHNDTKSEAIYKRTLNSFFLMEKWLKSISDLNEFGEANNVISKGKYLDLLLRKLGADIYQSYYYLGEAQMLPEFNSLMEESLKILQPLEEVPLIGNYIKQSKKLMVNNLQKLAAQPSGQTKSTSPLINVWNEQMAIVSKSLNIQMPIPLETIKGDAPLIAIQPVVKDDEPQIHVSLSNDKRLAASLYKLESTLNKFKTAESQAKVYNIEENDEQILQKAEQLIKHFNGLSYGPGSTQKFISGISKAINDISGIAHLGREVIFSRIEDLPDKFLTGTLRTSDMTEIKLGLKPGTITNNIIKKFDEFYVSLLNKLDFDDEATAIAHLSSNYSVIESRIAHVENELTKLKSEKPEQLLYKNLFVIKDQDLEKLNLSINSLQNLDLQINLSPSDKLVRQRQEVLNSVQVLFPAATKPTNIDQLISLKEQAQNSPFRLISLMINADFSDTTAGIKNRQAFIEAYDKLQPSLHTLDIKFDRLRYLRELQSQKDFREQAKNISKQKSLLLELIDSKKHDNAQQQTLCTKQLDNLNSQKQNYSNNIKLKRLETYKNINLISYVKQNIKYQLPNNCGEYRKILLKELYRQYQLAVDLKDINQSIPLKPQIEKKCIEISPQLLTRMHKVNTYLVDINNISSKLNKLVTEAKKSPKNPHQIQITELIKGYNKLLKSFKKTDDFSEQKAIDLKSKFTELSKNIKQQQSLALVYKHVVKQISSLPDSKAGNDQRKVLKEKQADLLNNSVNDSDSYKSSFFDAYALQAISKGYSLKLGRFKNSFDALLKRELSKDKQAELEKLKLSEQDQVEDKITKYIDSKIESTIKDNLVSTKQLEQLANIDEKINKELLEIVEPQNSPFAAQKQEHLKLYQNDLNKIANSETINKQDLNESFNKVKNIEHDIETYNTAVEMWQMLNEVERYINQEVKTKARSKHMNAKKEKITDLKAMLYNVDQNQPKLSQGQLKEKLKSVHQEFKNSIPVLNKFSDRAFVKSLYDAVNFFSKLLTGKKVADSWFLNKDEQKVQEKVSKTQKQMSNMHGFFNNKSNDLNEDSHKSLEQAPIVPPDISKS